MDRKRTKIVATISDKKCDAGFIRELYESGMDVVRINSAHLTIDEALKIVKNVREVSDKIAILLDTKGPEIRTTICNSQIKLRKGKKISKERNYFPGYVLIEAALVGELTHIIRNIPNVLGFLGTGNVPSPMRASEVKRILGKVDVLAEQSEGINVPFIVGETVKVVDGPFNSFSGVIEEINPTIAQRSGWMRKRFSANSRIQSPNRIPCQKRGDHAG